MESLTPFIRHELEDAPGPSGPPEETSSMVSPPLGAIPGQPPVTEPPKPGRGSQQPPSQPDGPDVQLPPPEVPQPCPDCSIPMTDGTTDGISDLPDAELPEELRPVREHLREVAE